MAETTWDPLAGPDALAEPLTWHEPRTVTVDLGDTPVAAEVLARMWAVMAATPRHTYRVHTGQPDHVARILADDGFSWQVTEYAEPLPGRPAGFAWPLHNVQVVADA